MSNALEIIRPESNALKARVAIVDFDGTISLVRAGWVDVMIPMMVEYLLETKSGESEAELTEIVTEYVGRLTGRQTMYQMIELADQITKRGGTPKDPVEYKHEYLDRLMVKITDRREGLRSGKISPDELAVPGSRRFLSSLRERGLTLYLASGTDQQYVREECDLLDFTQYFNGGVFGALDDYKNFSKRILIEKLVGDSEFEGEEFIGIGDGFPEIEHVKTVGGVGLGIASDEPECVVPDPVKRERLIGVGADWIVPNFNAYDDLMKTLFPA